MKCCMYVDLSLYRGRTTPTVGGTPAYHACTAPTAPLPGRRRNGHSLDSVYPSRSRDLSVRAQLFSTSDIVRTDVIASKPVPAAGELGGHVRCQSIYKGGHIARRIGLLAWLCLRGLSGICRSHGMGSWWVFCLGGNAAAGRAQSPDRVAHRAQPASSCGGNSGLVCGC